MMMKWFPGLLVILCIVAAFFAGCTAPENSAPDSLQNQTPPVVEITDRMADCAGDTLAVYGHLKSNTGYNTTVDLVARAYDEQARIRGEGKKTLDLNGNETVSFMIWIPGGCPTFRAGDYSVSMEHITVLR